MVATDASRAQLAHARAEACPPADGAADLVAVAQALHWFDLPAFYAEARRVVRPGGLVAAWSYGDARLDDAAADALLRAYDAQVVGPDWPAERARVRDGYRALPFPFAPAALDAPAAIRQRWTADERLAYLATWSATARHAERTGRDPLDALAPALHGALGGRTVAVTRPLALLARRV